MNNDLEKKWREEFDNKFYFQRSSETDNCGEYISGSRAIAWQVYLSARKAAQVEIDKLELSQPVYIRREMENKLKDRDQEIKRLKNKNERFDSFCKEWVYGEENPDYYKTMGEKIKERDELIKELRSLGTCDIDCDGVKCSKTCKKKSMIFEKARKLIGEKQ